MPELAEQIRTHTDQRFRVWCIGCAAGEDVYTLRLLCDLALQQDFPEIDFSILGTNVDANQIERARTACYSERALRELPDNLRQAAFEKKDRQLSLLHNSRIVSSSAFRMSAVKFRMKSFL